jgi:hypothetical protein
MGSTQSPLSRRLSEPGKVIEFKPGGEQPSKPDLHVDCPRCGKSNFMHDQRCQHCGLWFAGEAFQFAPSEPAPNRRRLVFRIILWYLVVVAAFFAIALVWGGLSR